MRAIRLSASFLTAVLMLAAATTPAASTPGVGAVLQLTRTVGPPTSSTLVQGRGFGSTETVDLTFDADALGTATTDPSGVFQARVQIPASALPGRHEVTATGESSGLIAQAQFIVNTDWSTFHYGPARTGFNPYENVLNPSNVSGLHLVWRFEAFASGTASPASPSGNPLPSQRS